MTANMEITKEKILVSSVCIVNPKSAECNHIIGYSEGVYEAWLDYADKPIDKICSEIVFKFCPLCGKELDKHEA